jgi:hypothetical protein
MFSECANPACRAPFDYREGTFFRFRRQPLNDGQPANTHSIQHLWLCGSCSKTYGLEYEQGRGILLRPLIGNAIQLGMAYVVSMP